MLIGGLLRGGFRVNRDTLAKAEVFLFDSGVLLTHISYYYTVYSHEVRYSTQPRTNQNHEKHRYQHPYRLFIYRHYRCSGRIQHFYSPVQTE